MLSVGFVGFLLLPRRSKRMYLRDKVKMVKTIMGKLQWKDTFKPFLINDLVLKMIKVLNMLIRCQTFI